MVKVLRSELLPKQAEFYECNDQIHGLVGGLASGKTNIACKKFLDRIMRYPRGNHAIANRDLPQYKRGSAISLIAEMKERNIPFKYNRTTGEITVRATGAIVMPLSAENYLGWRALEADTIWADELTTWGPSGEEAFKEFLVPRSRLSPEGKGYKGLEAMMFFTTNPPVDTANWVYTVLVRQKFCRFWNMSTRDNYLMCDEAGNPTGPEYVKKLERLYSPDMWSIYIDGQFGNVAEGAAYKTYDDSVHNIDNRSAPWPAEFPKVALDEDRALHWTLDFNVGLMCSVVSQYFTQKRVYDKARTDIPPMFQKLAPIEEVTTIQVPDFQGRILYVIDEIRMPDCGTPDVVEEFLRRYYYMAKLHGVRIYGDAAGGARSQTMSALSSVRSNWGIILERFQREGIKYQFNVQLANPAVQDRINMVKSQMRNLDGIGLVLVGSKCEYLIQDFLAVKYKRGTNDLDKENPELTHLSDALGYQIWLERTISNGYEVRFMSERNV